MDTSHYFELGGTVLCINTHEHLINGEPLYVRGGLYTVDGMRLGCKHSPVLLLLREVQTGDDTYCTECKAEFLGSWHEARDFVAIVPDEAEELSEYTPEELLAVLGK